LTQCVQEFLLYWMLRLMTLKRIKTTYTQKHINTLKTPECSYSEDNLMQKHAIITLILLSTLIPFTPFPTTESSTLLENQKGPLIESFLMLELSQSKFTASSGAVGCEALLRFEDVLTPVELSFAENVGIHFIRRRGSIIHVGPIYSALVTSMDSINKLSSIGLIQATSGSKKYYPSLTTSVEAIHAPEVWSSVSKGDESINGSGIRVAIIDTGISLIHPSFWRSNTPPLDVIEDNGQYYVDLNDNEVADANEGPIRGTHEPASYSEFDYSQNYLYLDDNNNADFDFDEGERWLGGYDENNDGMINLPDENVSVLGECKVVLLYNQDTGLVYERGVNLTTQGYSVTDYHGHGTHVASIIAGGQPGFTDMIGVAPGADLIIIRSPLESSDILDGIHFAIVNDAEVINMSFSSYLGFLDGTDSEDLAVTEAFRNYGVISSLAGGNLGGSRGSAKHAHFSVSSGEMVNVTLSVSSLPQYSFLNLLWRSTDMDERVVLTPSEGEPIDLGSFNELEDASIIQTDEIYAYAFKDVSFRGYCRLIIQKATSDHYWDSGIWTLTVENPEGEEVIVDGYAWDNEWTTTKLVFGSHGVSTRTISSPATADLGIAVAAYDEGSETIMGSSSRGPRIDGVAKPEIAAPGSSILAANRLSILTSLWTTRSGTSMACPHIAGVLALIKQASDDNNGWESISALLEGAGGIASHQAPPDNAQGYGLCDSLWSVRHVLDLPFDSSMTLNKWEGFRPLISDPSELDVGDELDIRSVREYQEIEYLGLAVVFDDTPNFQSENILTIRWNTDSNSNTGINGADILVNITNGEANPFTWSDTSYIPSSISVDWWNDSESVFVYLEKPEAGLRGSLSVVSTNASTQEFDETFYATLKNQWRPLVQSISMTSDEEEIDMEIQLSDRDDIAQSISMDWTIFDGGLNELLSGNEVGTVVHVNINLGSMESEDLISILLEVNDSHETMTLPLIALSKGMGVNFSIEEAYLNQTSVRVGPLINEHITGMITITGYSLITEVYISFKAEQGYFLNFSLTGSDGEYPIDITPSGFVVGEYEAYAVAETQLGNKIETHFANIEIIEDNSVIILGGSAVIVVIIAAVLVPRLINRSRKIVDEQ
jgi:subtilisin family serine protease